MIQIPGRLLAAGVMLVIVCTQWCPPVLQHNVVVSSNSTSIYLGKQSRSLRSVTLTKLAQRRQEVTERQLLKPRLVLHVGPSKTGTTSLQTDLTRFHDRGYLAADNYYYAGRYYHPFYNEKGFLQVNRTLSPLLEEARGMLGKECTSTPRSKCCAEFKRQLDEFKQQGQNVILSDEAFNHYWLKPDDYRAIREALLDEWDVVVLVGYRRLYEWLPSYKYQHDRLDHKNVVWKNAWPGKGGGKPIEPMFPTFFANWRHYFPYSDFAIKNAQEGGFPIEVLSLYDKEMSTRSNFLCNILVNADTACKESLFQDMKQDETTMNTRAGSPSFFYDALATAAAAHGLVDTRKATRRQVAIAIQMYQEEHLNLTSMDFQLDCPSALEVEDLLRASLKLEAKIMPDSFMDTEEEHIDGFREKVETKTYCWINTEAVLSKKEWKDFFQQREAA